MLPPPAPQVFPSPLGRGGRSLPASQLHPGLSIACARLPAPRSGALLFPASASTVGGNECLAVLVPARLSITLFTCLQGNLLPLVRLEKLTPCAGERERARPWGRSVHAKVDCGAGRRTKRERKWPRGQPLSPIPTSWAA